MPLYFTPDSLAHLGRFEYDPDANRWTCRELIPAGQLEFAVTFEVFDHTGHPHEPDAHMVAMLEAYEPDHATLEPRFTRAIIRHFRQRVGTDRDWIIDICELDPEMPDADVLRHVFSAEIVVAMCVQPWGSEYGLSARFGLEWDDTEPFELPIEDGRVILDDVVS